MLTDSLKSEKIIVMALLKPGWEDDYYGNPEIYEVAGMGRIVSSETFNDGRSNIVLYGLKRIKILEFVESKPYRKARIEILENRKTPGDVIYNEKIKNLITVWNDLLGTEQSKHKLEVNVNLPLENLTDVLASVLVTNIFERQAILEETDVEFRAERLIKMLETRIKYALITFSRKESIIHTRNLN